MLWDEDFFDEFRRMREELNRMANRLNGTFNHKLIGQGRGKAIDKYRGFRIPVSDIRETESKVIATLELPGADKNDIDVNVTDNMVEVKVEKRAEKGEKKKNSFR